MLELYRKKLLVIWCVGFLIPFVLIIFQYGGGKYGAKSQEVFGWLTSLTVPTILIMVGVMISNPVVPEDDSLNKPDDQLTKDKIEKKRIKEAKETKEKSVFAFAVGISLLYLLIINAFFFLEPLWNVKPQELMRDLKVYLAIFDSVISLVIGYFFGRK